jgi:hypothetical protein
MFVVDGRRFFSNNKLLSKVLVDIKTSSEKPLSVYFAVLCKSGSEDYYVLRDISPIAMVTPGEQKEIVLPHTKKEDGHQTFEVHKGDIFALLLPGVYDMSKVKADFGMFKTVMPFDYSKPYFKKRLSDLKRETNDSKELRPDLLFVSFKVE